MKNQLGSSDKWVLLGSTREYTDDPISIYEELVIYQIFQKKTPQSVCFRDNGSTGLSVYKEGPCCLVSAIELI